MNLNDHNVEDMGSCPVPKVKIDTAARWVLYLETYVIDFYATFKNPISLHGVHIRYILNVFCQVLL
jgi:hypothetical protein